MARVRGRWCESRWLLLLFVVAVVVRVSQQSVSTEQKINDPNPSTDSDDDVGLMVVEDEESHAVEERDVFVPTKEWQVVKEGQPIPPGLHIRMNLQTGLKEAKLLDGDIDTHVDSDEQKALSDADSVTDPERERTSSDESPKFTGDNRRTHYFGKSDRRGIVNKKTKVFSKQELMEAMNREEEEAENAERMLLTSQEFQSEVESPSVQFASHDVHNKNSHVGKDGGESGSRRSELPYTLHEEVGTMLEHTQTLAREDATVSDLIHALEELEYHVHNLDNAKDFNAIGGLVLVIRQLNHSSPEVRSHAAHVIGAASQSNPTLQLQVFDYGGLDHLCTLISAVQPDLVQRRSLFALSTLLRGNINHQLIFLERCKGLEVLGRSFRERGTQMQLKAVTLLTDIMSEQEEQNLRPKGARKILPVLHNSILEHGWCEHVATPIHSEEGTHIEKGLQAMKALERLCDFSSQIGRLKKLTKQFEIVLEEDQNELAEYTELLLDYSKTLLRTIRRQNLDL